MERKCYCVNQNYKKERQAAEKEQEKWKVAQVIQQYNDEIEH
jgi:hypothetical protein